MVKNAVLLQTKRANFLSYPIGEYQCKLDAKGRLMIPADFKEQLGNLAEEGFVLRPGLFSRCVELYTIKDWMEKQGKLKNMSQFVKTNIDLMRKYNAGAKLVKLDATGRMLIPKHLLERAGLLKEVVINALPEYMEIWDKESYRSTLDEMDQITLEELLEQKLGESKNG